MLIKLVAGMDVLLHTEMSAGTVTVGAGFTVMVYWAGIPEHPLTVGVTVIVAVTGLRVVLVVVKEGTLPIPLDPSPIEVSEFVHINEPPVGVLTKFVVAIIVFPQTDIFAGTDTDAIGLTVMVYVAGVPAHPLSVGVTVIVAEIGMGPVLIPVNEVISPLPFEASPMAVLELVHVNEPPAGILIKFVAGITALLHTAMSEGTVTVGLG